MTNYGPWSVKGIDQRAREAAREAAREEGLTLGEYINRMLLEETGGEAPAARDDSSPRYPRPEMQRPDVAHPNQAAGAGMGPANELLRELAARIEAVEARSSMALSGIDRSILDLTHRLEQTQRHADGKASDVSNVLDDIRSTHEALRDKVRALEEDQSKPQNLQALKSLETALGKLASHVYQETSAQKDQASAIRSRVESGLEDMGRRLSGMEGQIDNRLGEAEGRLARNVEQVELRNEGATRQLSNRFTELETSISGKLERVDALKERVEKVETGVAQRSGAFETRLVELRARLERAETATDVALSKLEKTFSALDQRVEHIADTALPEAAKALREQFEGRFDSLASELRTSIETTRRQLAAEIEEVSGRAMTTEDVARINAELGAIREEASTARSETGERFEALGETLRTERDDAAQRLEEVRRQLASEMEDAASRAATPEDIARLGAQFDTLEDTMRSERVEADQRLAAAQEQLSGEIQDVARQAASPADVARLAEAIEALRGYVETQKTEADSRLDQARRELEGQISHLSDKAVSPDTVAGVQSTLASLREHVSKNEESAGRTLERVTEQISRISTGLARRIKQVEDKDCARQVEELRGRLDALANDVAGQLQDSGSQTNEVIERITAEMQQMAERFDARINESEKRSATAIEQVGEQVSTVANRLQARQERSLRELEQSIDTDRKQQQKRLADALNGVSDRIEKMQEDSRTSLSPVQKAIASLATRLETFEDSGKSKPDKAGKADVSQSDLGDFLSDDPLPPRSEESAKVAVKPAAKSSRDDAFDGDLPFLDDFDDAPPVDAGGMYEYETDLPDDDGDMDAIGALSSWDDADAAWDDGGSETRDSDLHDERPVADRSWGLSDADTDDEPPTRRASSGGGTDYLSRARQAALQASETQPVKARKQKSSKGAKPVKAPKQAKAGKSKVPLVAAVSVVALATAAAGALFALRGMQDDGPRPTVQTRDTISLASADTGAAAAPAGFDEAVSGDVVEETLEGTLPVDTDAAPGETVNSVQAPAAAVETDPDLFDEEDGSNVQEAATIQPAEAATDVSSLAGLDPVPAMATLQSAADNGDATAQYILGQQRLDAGDYTAGPTLIRRAAEQDMAAAQYRLAKLHEKGLGVPRDLAMARQWTERAAQGGNAKAMHDLAVYYAQGDGGPQSYAGAAEWFRRAADLGVTDSQYNLALLYELGSGVSEDPAQALFWYTVAAGSGDAEAPAKVDELTQRLSADAASAAKNRAGLWSPAAQDALANGNIPARSWNGQSAEQVKAVQTVLAAMGYEPGPADGLLGTGTIDAISAYQADNGLEQTGQINAALVESLNTAIAGA